MDVIKGCAGRRLDRGRTPEDRIMIVCLGVSDLCPTSPML